MESHDGEEGEEAGAEGGWVGLEGVGVEGAGLGVGVRVGLLPKGLESCSRCGGVGMPEAARGGGPGGRGRGRGRRVSEWFQLVAGGSRC